MSDNWTELRKVVDLKHQVANRAFLELRRKEAMLRSALHALDSAGKAEVHNMHLVGGDRAWRVWTGKQKAGLNMSLARVLAEMESARNQSAHAQARVDAVAQLQKARATTQRDQLIKNQAAAVIQMALCGISDQSC
jgi:hypothetical protein